MDSGAGGTGSAGASGAGADSVHSGVASFSLQPAKRRRVHKKSAPASVGARKGSRWSGVGAVLTQAW